MAAICYLIAYRSAILNLNIILHHSEGISMEVVTAADPPATPGPEVVAKSSPQSQGFNEKLAAYLGLTKPRITSLVVLSALAGFALGSHSPIDWLQLLHTAIGVALLSGGINALNQYWERDLDALMRRTFTRPLPAGKLSPGSALVFGILVSLVAEVYLAWFLNPLTCFWGMIALASYLLHAAQNAHALEHIHRRFSRGFASAARLGGGAQRGRS
jgi:hypothetical protein